MKPSLYERYLRIISMMAQGLKPTAIVKAIASEFKVSERTAWRYWSTRENWMPEIVRLEGKSEAVISELLAALQETRTLLFNTYLDADNSAAKVGALKQIAQQVVQEIDIRQSLGLLPRKPIEIDQKTEVAGPPTIIVQVDPLMEGSDEDEPENRVEA